MSDLVSAILAGTQSGVCHHGRYENGHYAMEFRIRTSSLVCPVRVELGDQLLECLLEAVALAEQRAHVFNPLG